MDNNHFFFVNVCRRLVCAVYFVIGPISYTYFNCVLILNFAVYTYQHVIVPHGVAKWT